MEIRLSAKGLDLQVDKVHIPAGSRSVPALVLMPKSPRADAPGVLWIHGGGYLTGMKEMVFMSRAVDLVTHFGAVVVSPGYRLSWRAPYPAALEDCYASLLWLRDKAGRLGVNASQLMVGGESAGGGLCAAVCLLARDRGEVRVAYQMPLYPMIDNLDTKTSRDNRNKVWNTRRNHLAWKLYLRGKARASDVESYAAPARATDLTGLPPAYTFVSTGEPFYAETLAYVQALREAGVQADVDVYEGLYHAFDMLDPRLPESLQARERFCEHFAWAIKHCFASQTGVLS
ncbi:MAG: alpha/beta hydrolase [Atopobiaceae bacterium]|nr:alpha/beta hydrolase [Atopobiaceae bacterium]MBR1828884.1 alpha/beta hydrolase [Atopobiaceae bacterium]